MVWNIKNKCIICQVAFLIWMPWKCTLFIGILRFICHLWSDRSFLGNWKRACQELSHSKHIRSWDKSQSSQAHCRWNSAETMQSFLATEKQWVWFFYSNMHQDIHAQKTRVPPGSPFSVSEHSLHGSVCCDGLKSHLQKGWSPKQTQEKLLLREKCERRGLGCIHSFRPQCNLVFVGGSCSLCSFASDHIVLQPWGVGFFPP